MNNQSRRKKKEKENIPRNNLVNDNFTSAIYHVPSMISVLWNMLTMDCRTIDDEELVKNESTTCSVERLESLPRSIERVLASKQSLMKTHFRETRSSSRKEDYTRSIHSPPLPLSLTMKLELLYE